MAEEAAEEVRILRGALSAIEALANTGSPQQASALSSRQQRPGAQYFSSTPAPDDARRTGCASRGRPIRSDASTSRPG